MRGLHPTIGNTFKDNYVLEFCGLPPVHSENRLQKALVQHMKQYHFDLPDLTAEEPKQAKHKQLGTTLWNIADPPRGDFRHFQAADEVAG